MTLNALQLTMFSFICSFNHAIKHFTISQKETGVYFLQGKLFASIQDLVGYYGKQEVPNKEEISGIYLKHPVLDLKRHHFFASTSKRQTSRDETQSEARTRNSWREKNEGRRTDRMENVKLTSQSFSVKAAPRVSESELGNKRLDARNGITPNRTNVPFAHNSTEDRQFSGYLQLNLDHESEATMSASAASRPISVYAGEGGGRRRSSDLEPGDRTLFSQQPTSPSFQSRLLQDRSPPQQQQEQAQRTVTKSPSCTPTTKAPHLQYCYARSPYTQLATSLVQRLREIEGDNASKCPCGIYHDDAELPRGWSFHRSTEPETHGRVLFTGPDGQMDWNLPLEVSLELSADQQDKIRDLICRPPPRPCSHFLDARGSGSRSATNGVIDSGYQSLSKQDT